MAEIDLNCIEDHRDLAQLCAAELVAGRVIQLPDASGSVRIRLLPSHEPNESPGPLRILARSAQAAFDLVPEMTAVSRRFIRKGWPGRVILGFREVPRGPLRLISRAARPLELFSPSHPFSQSVLELIPSLSVVVDRNSAGKTGEQCPSLVPSILVTDDGVQEFVPAKIECQGAQWHLVDPGSHQMATILRMSGKLYLFVCTGNTCRSPMAERIFRTELCRRLDCPPDELARHGFFVASAGLAAAPAYPASPESVTALARRSIDLSDHLSQQLTQELLDQADTVFTMTRSHLQTILGARPDLADRCHMLSSENRNVVDPIGGTEDDYEMCCQQIEESVKRIVNEICLPNPGETDSGEQNAGE